MTTQNVDKIYDGNGNQFNIQIDIDRVNNLQTALNGKAASSHTHACSDITSGTFPTARIADDAITAAKVKDNETLPCNISGTAKYSRIMDPIASQTIWSNNSYSGSGGGQHTILGTLTITTSTQTSGSTSYEASWTNVHENFLFQSRHSGDGIISVYICMPGDTNKGTTNPACLIRCFSAQTSAFIDPIKCYLKKGTSGVHYTYTFTIIMSVSDYNNCKCFGRLNHPDTGFTFKTSSNIITDAQLTEETYGTVLATCQYNRIGYADGWTTSRNFAIADSTSAHTGATSSVNGSANVTLKLPSTITASLVGNVTGNCSGSAGSVAWSGVTSKPDSFLNVSRGIAGCASEFVDITTSTLNTNDVVYLFDTNDGAGNSAAQIEINVVNLEGNGDHTLVCVNSTTLRFRNTSSSLDYWLKRNDNGATKVPKNNNHLDVSLEPGMVIHVSKYGTTILCHSNAEWAQNSYNIAAHPEGLVDGREYNVAFVNAESSSSTQWSCLLRYDTDSLKYVPSTNTLKVTNLEGKATKAVQDALSHNIHTFYGSTIDITNTKTLQLKNAIGDVINAVELPYVPVVFDQLGSAEAVLYCL